MATTGTERGEFEGLNAFIEWYNTVATHESLDTKWYLQTPEEAFWGRLPVEVRVSMAAKMLGW
ncbi:MAG: hypothetical protein U9R10_04920 [Euryarchaeota archaeon]|nr:hypothetical protein [Euryarchaeota archaeon]